MRLTNPVRQNPLSAAVNRFSQDNRNVNFKHVRSVSSNPYRWQATTRFKVRNNFQTSKHLAYIGFYSDNEMMLNRYGNVFEANVNNFFLLNSRPQAAARQYELSTNQYKKLGQEYAEFDLIEYVDASAVITKTLDHADNVIEVFHNQGDAPVFVTAGYSIVNTGDGKTYYSVENEPVSILIAMNGFVITVADDESDIYGSRVFIAAVVAETTLAPWSGTFTI